MSSLFVSAHNRAIYVVMFTHIHAMNNMNFITSVKRWAKYTVPCKAMQMINFSTFSRWKIIFDQTKTGRLKQWSFLIFSASKNFQRPMEVDMTNRTMSTASKSTRTTHHRPYFDDVGPRNVTAVVGQSALLNCRVKHPGDRTVSI